MAGGNLGLIYFNAIDERLTLEQIEQLYPDSDPGPCGPPRHRHRHVRSEARGLLCLNKDGIHCLDDGEVEGIDPLAIYGEHAVAAIQRLDEIEHVGDIAVVSQFDPETGEIAAFEELIGAHGGLGGPQTRPFLLHPADWELDLAPLLGAPMVYQQLRRWMEEELGMTFGKQRWRQAIPGARPVGTEQGRNDVISDVLVTITQVGMLIFIVASMAAMGLGLTISQIVEPLRDVRMLLLLLAVNFIVVPVVAIARREAAAHGR